MKIYPRMPAFIYIEECAVFVADITENNPNVMYELGIAFNLKKPLLIIQERKKKSKVPVDISPDYRYKFSGIEDLEKLLITQIQSILETDYGAVFP